MTDGGLLYDPAPDPDDDLRRRHERADGLWTGLPRDPDGTQETATEVARLMQQVRRRLDRKDFLAAIALLDRALQLDGENAEAYLLTAECLLALDEPERALDRLDDAERYASYELRSRLEETRRRCAGACLEDARKLLRGGEPGRAVDVLRRCEMRLGGDEQVRLIHAYAATRLDRRGTGANRTDAPWLEAAELERVLRWLTREELAATEEALHERRFEAALRASQAAARIDSRGAYCALLSASAHFQLVQRAANGSAPPDPEAMRTKLAKATRLVRYAERDRSLDDDRQRLAAAINDMLRVIDRYDARVKEMAPVKAVFERYNVLMRHYHNSVLNLFEASNLISSLAPINAEVNRLRRRYPADSEAGRALAELARAIARTRDQLKLP